MAVVVEEDENLTNSTSADDMDQDDIELSHFENNDFSPENDVSDFDNKKLEHDDAFSREDYQRLSCFPHTLQLIVAKFDDVKPCKEAISTSKRLVARFNKSVKATEMLVKLSGKKLIGDCPTRWSSTYLLLKRLLAVRTDLETVICKLEWDGLQARHWKAIENVVVLLESFAEYTSLCGGEEYTSISCVVPVLMELKLHLEKVN